MDLKKDLEGNPNEVILPLMRHTQTGNRQHKQPRRFVLATHVRPPYHARLLTQGTVAEQFSKQGTPALEDGPSSMDQTLTLHSTLSAVERVRGLRPCHVVPCEAQDDAAVYVEVDEARERERTHSRLLILQIGPNNPK